MKALDLTGAKGSRRIFSPLLAWEGLGVRGAGDRCRLKQ
jgi:hypothetical protein